MTNQEYATIDQKYYLQTFKRYPVTLESGNGAVVVDVEGNEYVDALAGIAVNALGHNHPELKKAICEQAGKLIHISNFYSSVPQIELSKKLVEISGLDRVFLTNSGLESVEGAFKLARKYAHSKGRGGTIISMEGCFHGRSLATIATGKKAMKQGFEPIPQGFKQVPFNDMEAVRREAGSKEIGVVVVELIQGEGGINEATKDYIRLLRTFCTENDIVLIFDEIQSGIARTGAWFAKDIYGVQPDIMTLAKGLGGGVPIGAFLAKQHIANAIDYGEHGTTFGGNPLAAAAAMATLTTIEKDELRKEATEKGGWLRAEIEKLKLPSIKKMKGKGLMLGIEFDFETKPLVAEMLKNGVLANATAGNVLRLVPPLTIEYSQLQTIVDVIKKSVHNLKS